MTRRCSAMRSLQLFMLTLLGVSAEASAQSDGANAVVPNVNHDEQKLPVSAICGTEAFAQRWKIFDYRESTDSIDLVALGRTSPGDLSLIVRQLKAPLWTHRTAAAKALGVIGQRDPMVIDELQAIVDRGLPLLKGIKPPSEFSLTLPFNSIDAKEAERTDAFVVIQACISLARLGNSKPLMELVSVRNPIAQDKAFDAIMRLGLADPEFAAKIVENYSKGVWDIADAPIDREFEILGFAGKGDEEVIKFLSHQFRTAESPALRLACGSALWQISQARPDIADLLVALMLEGDLRTSSLATHFMARNEPPPREAIETTFLHLNRGDAPARVTALFNLPHLWDNDPACLAAIEDAVHDPTFSVRMEAATLLLRNGRWNDDWLEILAEIPAQQATTKVPLISLARLFAERSKSHRSVADVFLEWCSETADYADVYLEYDQHPGAIKLQDEVRGGAHLSVWAVRLLRAANCRDKDVIERVAQLTKSKNGDLRRAAIGTLFVLAPDDRRAINAIRRPKDLSQRDSGLPESPSGDDVEPKIAVQHSDGELTGFQEADRVFAECGELSIVPFGLPEYFEDYLLQYSEFTNREKGNSSLPNSALAVGIRLQLCEERVMQVMEEMAGTEDFEDSKIPTFIAERGKLDESARRILTQLSCHGHMPTRQGALEQLGAMAQQRSDWTDLKLLSDLRNPDVAVQIQASLALSYRLKTASDEIAPETRMLLQKMTQESNTAISLAAHRALWFIERRRAELLPDGEWEEFEKRAGVVPLPELPAF